MASSSLPRYVDIGSKQVFIPPYTASGISMFGFLIQSDNPAGVDNLLLAGDWTDNGFINAGCIEATTMSGLQAAALQAWVAERSVPATA